MTRRTSDDGVDFRDIELTKLDSHPAAPALAAGALDGLPLPQRYWAVLTVAIAVGMCVVDGTITNIALPTIAREVGASPAASIWIVNAYQLSLMLSLLPLSSLGDIIGYRKVYQTGFAVFIVASFCCALSNSLLSLALARLVQGVGAAGIVSVNTALIRTIFPSKILGRGMGINAMIVATSAAIGPTLAAGILSVARWPWLFAVNVPMGILGLAISLRTLPHTPGSGHRFDLKSALLSAITFGLLISGVDGMGHGQSLWLAAVEIVASVLIGTAFVRRELRQPAPLFAVDLMRRPIFALSVATSICSFIAQMLAYVSLPFYLQNVLGRSQVESGLLISPWPLAVLFAAPIAGTSPTAIPPAFSEASDWLDLPPGWYRWRCCPPIRLLTPSSGEWPSAASASDSSRLPIIGNFFPPRPRRAVAGQAACWARPALPVRPLAHRWSR